MNDNWRRVLFSAVWIELCMGGGGRFTAYGPLSLRMIFFAVALTVSAIAIVRDGNTSRSDFKLLYVFGMTLVVGVVVGFMNDASPKFIWEDAKPLLYFLMLPFFALMILSEDDVRHAARIIKGASFAIMILFLVTVSLVNLNVIDFFSFYKLTLLPGEIFYRGEITFFYKGFLFLGIGIVFFYFTSRGWFRYLAISLLSLALLLSFTRGLWMATALTFCCYFLLNKAVLKAIVMLTIALMILVEGQTVITTISKEIADQHIAVQHTISIPKTNLLGDRSFSDNERIMQVQQVASRVTLSSALIGHGLGIGVPLRPVHMEISYLEIFHKQGVVGLIFWSIVLWTLWRSYRATLPSPLTEAFFFATLFVFLQSLTNQYINNPIGISMILVSIVCLNVQRRSHE